MKWEPSHPRLRPSYLVLVFGLLSWPAHGDTPHYLDRYAPVAIWSLDEDPASADLRDTRGQFKAHVHGADAGLPASVLGAAPFTGRAWDFQGVSSSLRSEVIGRLQTLGDMDATQGASVSFWMNLHKDRIQRNRRLFGHPAVEATLTGIGYGGLGIQFGTSHQVGLTRSAAYRAFDGQWHHVAATADFGSRRNNVVIYLDGEEVARVDGAANASFHSTDPRTAFYVGARRNGGHPFPGALDDVAVFDFPLSMEQVRGIHTGPVFAGLPQVVYLPDTATLKGTVPENSTCRWSKISGPGAVRFANPAAAGTRVEFEVPGEYELELSADGYPPQVLSITVHPPTPPFVYAGDPIQLATTAHTASLSAQASVPGRPSGNYEGVTVKWDQRNGPGTVRFADATSARTEVRFSAQGIYHLQLTATRGALSRSDLVSVRVGEDGAPHYALLLNPLYLLALDDPANRDAAGIEDAAAGTCAELAGDRSRLPQMLAGARPFTGAAWDFSGSPAKIKVHNRFNLARLGDLERTRGMAVSFWLRADAFTDALGRVGGGTGLSVDPHKYSEGIGVTIEDVAIHTPVGDEHGKLYDRQWHHIVATADFTAETDNVRLYVDGRLAARTSHRFTASFGTPRTDRAHFWGCRSTGGGGEFTGQLDDLAMFDRPLAEPEIAYLYEGPTPAQEAQLRWPKPVVDAGDDQLHRLPVKAVRLNGKAEASGQVTYHWSLERGPGPVNISTPEARTTTVNFGPVGREHHNPDYRHYIFRLTARDGNGLIARSAADHVSVVFHDRRAPATRRLSAPPPPGVHPRIFFNPDDLPAMRARYAADPYAQKAAALLRADYDRDLYNPNTPMGLVNAQLREGRADVDVKFVVGDNDTRSYWQGKQWLYGSLAGAAAIALLEDDQARLKELATVLSRAAVEHLKYYRPNYPNKLTHDASGGLALAYDFLAARMDESQRAPVRRLLSRMSRWRQSLGSAAHEARHVSTNWLTHHDQIVLTALAIEGEEGFDPDLVEQARHKLRTFLTQYGIFKSGYGHEGYTYVRMGMESGALSALALSRRGENLYETTHLFNCGVMMFRSMPPGAYWVTGHGDASPEIDGMTPLDWTLRYLWPDDPAITYLIKRRLDWLLSDQASDKQKNQSFNLMALLFAVGPQELSRQEDAARAHDLPTSYFCPDKGYMNARSSWEDDAVNLVFRCRMDKYALGHMHPDVNSFELYANGTTWFWDPGKYPIENDMHQTILIDGRSGGGSSDAFAWPSLPGRFVHFEETADKVTGTGDAKAFYDFVPNDSRNANVSLEAVPIGETGLMWADFVYGKTHADLASMPVWRDGPFRMQHGSQEHLYRYNPVKRALRTATLVKGPYPYVLIEDDYRKDDGRHTYEWVGNLEPGTVEVVSRTAQDLVLKKVGADDRGNRLLVRVLEAHGGSSAPELIHTELGGSPGNPGSLKKVTQVRITADHVVAPNFRLLLYPFVDGAPLPDTTLSNGLLQVDIAGRTDTLAVEPAPAGEL